MITTPYANSLFEQPWWLDIVAPGRWEEIIIKDEKDRVVARMPYVSSDRNIFMPKMTQTIGVWLNDELLNDVSDIKKHIYLIFEKLNKYKNVVINLSPNNSYVLPFRWLGYKINPNFTYRINNLTDCQLLYQNFNKTAKKNIKYAKNKVTINSNLNFEELWNMLNKTFEAQNRKNPMPKEIIENIVQTCEENQCGKYFKAVDNDGNIHSCAYFVYDEKVCYYLIGASDSKYRNSGAQSLIIWEGIQFSAKHSKVFDFEGSMVEGIENFFRQFGGECTVYYQVSKLPLYKEIFDLLKPRIKRLIGYKI